MPHDRDELEQMKRDIDLRVYAAEHGYQFDRKESWRGSSVMRNPATGDKIIVKLDADGHFVFFSVHNGASGSIIDFAQAQLRASIGAIRKELRPWINRPATTPLAYAPLPRTSRDRISVEAAYIRTEAVTRHPYLEKERGLPASVIGSDRFRNRIRKDARGNAVFPHFDGESDLCGMELKNVGFTGFSPGGTKGLWLSQERPDDQRLVLAESAIDALSHAALYPDDHARFASVGGQVNPRQPELISAASARMPHGSEIIAAMDADTEGRKLAMMVRDAVAKTGRSDLRFVSVAPFGHKDWNDALRARPMMTTLSESASPGPR